MNALASGDASEKKEEKDSEKNREKFREKTGEKSPGRSLQEGSQESSQNTRDKIVLLMKENPSITIEQLVAQTGLSRRGVEWNIDVLKKNGMLERKGSRKTGIWMIKTVGYTVK